jgi:hypothetical protein
MEVPYPIGCIPNIATRGQTRADNACFAGLVCEQVPALFRLNERRQHRSTTMRNSAFVI